jgi:hypothetical protein
VVWEFGSVAQPWRRCSRAQASPIGLAPERVCSGSPCRHPQGQGLSATSTTCAGAVQRHACAQRVEEPQVGLRKSSARGLCRTSSDLALPRCRPEPARLTCRRSSAGTLAVAVAPCHPAAEANQHGAVFAAGLESYPLTHCTSFVARRCSDTMRLAAATGCLGTGAGSDAAS